MSIKRVFASLILVGILLMGGSTSVFADDAAELYEAATAAQEALSEDPENPELQEKARLAQEASAEASAMADEVRAAGGDPGDGTPAPLPGADPEGASAAKKKPVDYGSGDRFEVFEIFNPLQNDSESFENKFRKQPNVSPIAQILVNIANFLVRVGGVVAVLVLVLGSLLFVTAEGRENQIQQGKDVFFYGIVGLVIILFSFLISVVIQSLLFP